MLGVRPRRLLPRRFPLYSRAFPLATRCPPPCREDWVFALSLPSLSNSARKGVTSLNLPPSLFPHSPPRFFFFLSPEVCAARSLAVGLFPFFFFFYPFSIVFLVIMVLVVSFFRFALAYLALIGSVLFCATVFLFLLPACSLTVFCDTDPFSGGVVPPKI